MKFGRHRHARGILDLRSRCRYLAHDPDAVVFAQWPNRVTPLVVMVGRMGRLLAVGKWPRILKRDLPSGPRVLRRLAPAVALTSAAPITPSHEYYCSNNGKRLRN